MYYKRSAWTNKPNNSVAFKGIQTSITFHYPGFGNAALQTKNWNLQKCFNQIRTWENQHQARGSKNIEYNFFVLPTGDVVEGRGFRQSGANGNSAANRYSISVQVLIGDNEPLNSKFLKGIAEALKLIKQHQPKALNKFYPHKHWVGTRCPGPAIEAALRNGTINKNMAAGSTSIPVGNGASVPAPRPIQSSNLWETSPTIKAFTKEQTKQLQNDLIKAGFSVGSYGADGSYKGDTIKAVKAFQKKHKLAIDGVAGPKTLLKLGEVLKGSTTVSKPSTTKPTSKAPAYPLPKGFYYGPSSGPVQSVSGRTANSKTKDVVKDSKGKHYSKGLKQWQAQMKKRGWTIDVDGRYGPKTERVVKQFQTNKKLSIDGKIGPATWKAAWNLPVK